MPKRSYGQNCALAHATDLIGERWTLLLIRDLLIAPRRFMELSRSMRGMGSNLLSARLRELEATGIITRDDGEKAHYRLTRRGEALEPAVLALIRWGLQLGSGRSERSRGHHRDDWDLLALKALLDPQRLADLELRLQFQSPEFQGWVSITAGRAEIGLGVLEAPDILINGTVQTLQAGEKELLSRLETGEPQRLLEFLDRVVD